VPVRRRFAVLLVGAAAVGVLGRPVLHLGLAVIRDRQDREATPSGSVDDASALDATRVAEVWAIPSDPAVAEAQLRALIVRAAAAGVPVSIAGARHSMGGHSIRKDGIVVDMRPFHAMRLEGDVLHVQAGALWSDVLPHLNRSGRSVAVMQSNNSFSVGGSISVNCHGWQARRPPIASSVLGFRILRADGSIVGCSRSENPELFSLALGGYGLFGIILDVELRVVPNEEYRLERAVLPAEGYAPVFESLVARAPDVSMAYGRLSVAPESFLREAILSAYHRVPAGSGKPSPTEFPEITGLTRALFRGQVGSDYGKSLRWRAEKGLGGSLGGTVFRNQLLGEPAEVFANRSAASTDILHEYFVPPESFAAFVDEVRRIVPKHGGDLLNVTVRDLVRDDDAFLRYADRDMLALVMLFNQPRTAAGEASMQAMTRDLIDAALRGGGRYYLPYRLHATRDQLRAAYPRIDRFFELKRRYDPQDLFQNEFYVKYAR
jgi:FAD/FMN-containing dehydrogenase